MKPDEKMPNNEIDKTQLYPSPEMPYAAGSREAIKNPFEQCRSAVEKENAPINTTSPIVVLPSPASSDGSVVVTASSISGSPAIAQDDDLIEKEWVEKAKKIISQNRNDPHKQEEEATGLKVDYLKKRFGRDLSPAEKK